MKKLLFKIGILGFGLMILISTIPNVKASQDYTLCEGSGERCVVKYNGVPVAFVNGKNDSAIVIKF